MIKNSLFHPVKLPGLLIPGNLFLAPTAGFSNRAFREICIENGASFCFTEMVSCEALIRSSRKTYTLMERGDNELQLGIQLFTSNPLSAYKSICEILKYDPSLIDINCGCPVPKIVKSGAGSALMKTPELIGEITAAVKDAIPKEKKIPVSVKLRSGWDKNNLNFLECAEAAIAGGAAMISLHARTKTQGYSGFAEWDHIKALKNGVNVPVIGSGDLYTPFDAEKMLEKTLCDGVMFARGSFGNPFIFNQTKELISTGKIISAISLEQKIKTAFLHLRTAVLYFDEPRACREMKKHLCAYTKGIKGGGAFRNRIVHSESYAEYKEIFKEFMQNYNDLSDR